MNNTLLLFTSCVKPNPNVYNTVILDEKTRYSDYSNALHFYLSNTDYDILIVDNSNFEYPEFQQRFSSRLEILSFQGDSIISEKGKGYGEGIILGYAFLHSRFIKERDYKYIEKISGRHIVTNFRSIDRICSPFLRCSNKTVIAALFEEKRWAVSDYFIAPPDFYRSLIIELQTVDDRCGRNFEHVLFDTIFQHRRNKSIHFIHLPIALKQLGTNSYNGKNLGTIGSTSKFYIKALLYSFHCDYLISFYNQHIRQIGK